MAQLLDTCLVKNVAYAERCKVLTLQWSKARSQVHPQEKEMQKSKMAV